jgi:hypothetical protein
MRTGPILKLICGSTERGETIRISLTGCVRLVDADESGATARSIDWQRNCQTKFWHACLKSGKEYEYNPTQDTRISDASHWPCSVVGVEDDVCMSSNSHEHLG